MFHAVYYRSPANPELFQGALLSLMGVGRQPDHRNILDGAAPGAYYFDPVNVGFIDRIDVKIPSAVVAFNRHFEASLR